MARYIGMETMLHISFSLAGLVFSVVLFVLVCVRNAEQGRRNMRFSTFTAIVMFGNLLSILDNIFRDSGAFATPAPIQLLLLLGVYVANALLTYYMAHYMEGFFGEFRWKQFFHRFHLVLVTSAILIAGIFFVSQMVRYRGDEIISTVPIWIRILLGYVYELYFLVYVTVLFIVCRKALDKRARITSVSAFAIVIGSILLELQNTFGVGSGILFNYFGAVLGLFIFYIGVETPDYQNLLHSMKELEEARRQADEASRFKSDFLANMSHEIRTPINGILGMNEMILREAEDPDILSYSKNIGSAGATLLGLVNDILDFSKIEAGKVEICPEHYDLAGMLSNLVNMAHARAEEKGLSLQTEFDSEMPRHLFGDEVRIKQVISNILINAVKYTEQGSITFSVKQEKLLKEPDSVLLHVSVKDTGIGIKKEDLTKLFVEFERIEEKRNRHIEGTGLGLTITKRLLTLMGSSLQVESVYGEGSTFSFVLKQSVTNWAPMGDYEYAAQERLREHERYRAGFTAPTGRILLVDDNQMNLIVVKSLLKQTKIQVDTASGGDEGLFLMQQNAYDVILLDHMMPQKDGIETLKELRSLENSPNQHTTAICLTANAISGAREQYLEAGFEDYLPKPINSRELERLLLFYLPQEKITRTQQKSATPAEEKPAEERRITLVPETAEKPAEAEPAEEIQEKGEPDSMEEDGYTIPEELYVLDSYGVDVEAGVQNSDDPEVYVTLLQSFYDDLGETAGKLDQFRSAQDWENYTVLVHSMKSTLRLLGVTELGETAQSLEFAAKDQNLALIDTYHDAFLEQYRSLKEPLAKVFYLLG